MIIVAAPKTINGHRVIASCYTDQKSATRAGHVVIVDRGEEAYQRYATSWIGVGDREWTWGHYFDDYTEAVIDYGKRCERGY